MDRAIVESARLLGLSSLKEEQTQCIKEFIKGRDVFAILPTGYGKTFCYSKLCHPCMYVSYLSVAVSVLAHRKFSNIGQCSLISE